MENIHTASFLLGSFVALPFAVWAFVAQSNLLTFEEKQPLLETLLSEKQGEILELTSKDSMECATMIYTKEQNEAEFARLLTLVEMQKKEIEILKSTKKRGKKKKENKVISDSVQPEVPQVTPTPMVAEAS